MPGLERLASTTIGSSGSSSRRGCVWEALWILGLAAVVLGHGRLVRGGVYGYDEADYRAAATRTLADHWLDRPSIPFSEFIARGRSGAQPPGERLELSEYIRDSGDLPFLRHYHGPLYWYLLIPALRLTDGTEGGARSVGLAWLLLLAWVVYGGCRWLRQPRVAAGAAAVFVALSTVLLDACLRLGPHGPYALLTTAILFLAARAMQTGSARLGLGAVAAAGLTVVSLEYTLFLLAALVVCGLIAARQRRARGREVMRFALCSAAVLAAAVFLLWPAGILKLTLVRDYLYHGYIALLRPGAYGAQAPLSSWGERVMHSPLEWALLAALVAAFVVRVRREGGHPCAADGARGSGAEDVASEVVAGAAANEGRSWAAPFAVYALLFLSTTLLNTSPEARFLASLVPVLAILAAAGLAGIVAGRPRAVCWGALAGLAALLGVNFYARPFNSARPDVAATIDGSVVAALRAGPTPARLLVPQHLVPILRWYFPQAEARAFDGPGHLVERAESWRPDAVVYWGAAGEEIGTALAARFDVRREPLLAASGSVPAVVLWRLKSRSPAATAAGEHALRRLGDQNDPAHHVWPGRARRGICPGSERAVGWE